MAYGDSFSSVQDAALREKAMRDQNINAAFQRMMQVKQLNTQAALAQQQMAFEHEKLKASMIAAAMAHDQAQRHNDILEKQVDGYLGLQKAQLNKGFETDDHMGQTLVDNLDESTKAGTESEKNYEVAKQQFGKYQSDIANMYDRSGIISKNKQTGLYEPNDPNNTESQNTAEFVNGKLQELGGKLQEAQHKYEYDAKHHAHIIDVASAKGFLFNGKTGELTDMQRGKKFTPSTTYEVPQAPGIAPGSSTGNVSAAPTASDATQNQDSYALPINVDEDNRDDSQPPPPTPSPAHIDYLKANPASSNFFDAKFGAGASADYLTK